MSLYLKHAHPFKPFKRNVRHIAISQYECCLSGGLLGGLGGGKDDDDDRGRLQSTGAVDSVLKTADNSDKKDNKKKPLLDTKKTLNSVDLGILKLFGQFKKEYKKSYENKDEEDRHYRIFESNTKEMKRFNKVKRYSYAQDINEFSDESHEEMVGNRTGFKDKRSKEEIEEEDEDENLQSSLNPTAAKRPTAWDWRDYGVVTEIRHQRKCGSCWSFASIAVLESHNMKRMIGEDKFDPQKPLTGSEQNLVDCAQAQGASGCSGGMPHQGWKYTLLNRGVDKQEAYPYEAAETGSCKYKLESKADMIVDGHKKITPGDDDALEQAIYELGPVAVAIHVTKSMPRYKMGIFEDPTCDLKKVNHAVVAIGYGEENGHKFFILRNSWGTKWGEKGYMRLSRKQPNACGISQKCYYPIVPGMKQTQDILVQLNKYKQTNKN